VALGEILGGFVSPSQDVDELSAARFAVPFPVIWLARVDECQLVETVIVVSTTSAAEALVCATDGLLHSRHSPF